MTTCRASEGGFIQTLKERSVISRIIAIVVLTIGLVLFRFNAVSLQDPHAEQILVGFSALMLCVIALHTGADLGFRFYYSRRAGRRTPSRR